MQSTVLYKVRWDSDGILILGSSKLISMPEHSSNPIHIKMIRRLHAVNSTLGNEIVLYQSGCEEWY
jgi:hypothetical protein